MIEKYFSDSNFVAWVDYNKFLSKLTGDLLIYNLYTEDNRIFKIVFLAGYILNYKLFIAVTSIFFNSFYCYEDRKRLITSPETKDVVQALVESEVFSEDLEPHPYHKNAKPKKHIRKGSRYGYIINKIENYDTNKVYYISDILAGKMEFYNDNN